MLVDSDSDVSILEDDDVDFEEHTRFKGKGKAKAVKKARDKGKGKAKEVRSFTACPLTIIFTQIYIIIAIILMGSCLPAILGRCTRGREWKS